MKCDLRCNNPDRIEYTIRMTASVKTWEDVAEQLKRVDKNWPLSELSMAITDVILQAKKVYFCEVKEV